METYDIDALPTQDIDAVLTLPVETVQLIEQHAADNDSTPSEVAAMWLVVFGKMLESGVAELLVEADESIH
jgi:hypothetical protein